MQSYQRTSKAGKMLVQMAGNTTYTLGSSATAAARCDYSSISVIRLQPTVLVPECLKPESILYLEPRGTWQLTRGVPSACNISCLEQLGGGFEG
jgi:hypothetical protein